MSIIQPPRDATRTQVTSSVPQTPVPKTPSSNGAKPPTAFGRGSSCLVLDQLLILIRLLYPQPTSYPQPTFYPQPTSFPSADFLSPHSRIAQAHWIQARQLTTQDSRSRLSRPPASSVSTASHPQLPAFGAPSIGAVVSLFRPSVSTAQWNRMATHLLLQEVRHLRPRGCQSLSQPRQFRQRLVLPLSRLVQQHVPSEPQPLTPDVPPEKTSPCLRWSVRLPRSGCVV